MVRAVASFLFLASLLGAQDFEVRVYHHGPAGEEEELLRAPRFADRVDVYDAYTGQLLRSEVLEVYAHVYGDGQIFWPRTPDNQHRRYVSMAWISDEQAWKFLGIRDRPLDGDWERVDVEAEGERLRDIARAIIAVDRDDPGEATLRREEIGTELISRIAAAPLEDSVATAALFASQVGMSSGQRYLVLRTFGWALFIYNDPEGMRRARVFYEQAIELKPSFGSGYYNLALVEKRLDNKDATLVCLLAAHRSSPSAKYLRKLKDEVTLYGETESLGSAELAELLSLVRALDADAPDFSAIDERFPQLRYSR